MPAFALALVATAGSADAASTLSTSGAVVTYTAGATDVNDLTIEVDGTDVLFTDAHTINGTGFCTKDSPTVARCAESSVASINVFLLDGADTLSVLSINDPIGSADMGSGDDTIILGPSANPITLDGIRASVSLDGGGGADTLIVKDTQDTSGDIVTVSLGSINTGTGDNFFGPGGSATFVQTETVSITTGTGNSLIRVRSSASGTSTTIDAGAGDDLFQISSDGTGQTGDLDGFLGPLTLLGGSGENGLLISDADAPVGNIATIGPTSISGLAPIPILYSASGTFSQALLIRGSGQLDTFAISGTIAGATIDIRTLGGTTRLSSPRTAPARPAVSPRLRAG